jgi:hypothetical protein
MAPLERKVDHGFTQLRVGIHRTFCWVIGVILVDWVTLMLVSSCTGRQGRSHRSTGNLSPMTSKTYPPEEFHVRSLQNR